MELRTRILLRQGEGIRSAFEKCRENPYGVVPSRGDLIVLQEGVSPEEVERRVLEPDGSVTIFVNLPYSGPLERELETAEGFSRLI